MFFSWKISKYLIFLIAILSGLAHSAEPPLTKPSQSLVFRGPMELDADAMSILADEQISFDLWSIAISKIRNQNREPRQRLLAIEPLIMQIRLVGSQTTQTKILFNKLVSLLSQNPFDKSILRNWELLALVIFQVRQDLRYREVIDIQKRRMMYLLQLMGEEVLYFAHIIHPNMKVFSFINDPQRHKLSLNRETSKGNIAGIQAQTGDILLSKNNGAGSSEFISIAMDDPHIYSHSTLVYLNNQGDLMSPEAYIEDGVKIRRIADNYQPGKKTRTAVYRLNTSPRGTSALQKSTYDFVQTMYQRVKDPTMNPAYGYDGTMDPFNAKDSYFCTTVSFDIYRRSGLTMKVNPYNPDYWSRISGPRYELFQFLGISSQRVPAPGDVEQSVFFDLVGMEIDVELLHRERIVYAAIELLLKYLDQEPEILVNIQTSLGQFGTDPVNKEFLKSLEAKHLIPSDFVKKFSAKIPDGLNLRQVVFFGLLDQVYTPRITQIAELELGKGPYGQNTLRRILSEVIKKETEIFLKRIQKN